MNLLDVYKLSDLKILVNASANGQKSDAIISH